MCNDGDVGLREGMHPLILWGGIWYPICAARILENEFATNLFCQKLGFESGKASANKSITIEEPSFMIGKCNENDSWPMCTGGCNLRNVGHTCRWGKFGIVKHSEHCVQGRSPKLSITCDGIRITRTIYSCKTK